MTTCLFDVFMLLTNSIKYGLTWVTPQVAVDADAARSFKPIKHPHAMQVLQTLESPLAVSIIVSSYISFALITAFCIKQRIPDSITDWRSAKLAVRPSSP
jgi:hypothetical protein